jgi:3-dehydrosphinganine reductase
MDYVNKNILISGGSSGIGFSLAKKFTQLGANVCILARREELLKSAQKQLLEYRISDSQKITYISADVGYYKKLKSSTKGKVDQIDILINSAGITYPGEFINLDPQIFEDVMRVNYLGTVYLTKLVVPGMIAHRSGYIVNITSAAANIGIFGYSTYSPSKFAVSGFSRCIRSELKAYGIDISMVLPMDTETPQLEFEHSLIPEITKKISAVGGRFQPDEVAEYILKGMKKRKFIILTGLLSKIMYPLASILENYFYHAAVREHRKQIE